jgi:TatA/E family protein of Tat protein translocase
MMTFTTAFIGNLAGPDMLIILALGLLIFGRRLPEMGKNIGKTIVEFKKGLNAATDEVASASREEAAPQETNEYRKVITTTAKPARNVKMLAQPSDEP